MFRLRSSLTISRGLCVSTKSDLLDLLLFACLLWKPWFEVNGRGRPRLISPRSRSIAISKMLQANKASVLTDFNLGSVTVRYMEVEYFLLVFGRINKLASVLAGFASSALMQDAGEIVSSPTN